MKWKKYLPFIGIAIFIYLLFIIDLRRVLIEIWSANIWFLLLSLVFILFLFVNQTIKWYLIARKQKILVPFSKALKINLVSHFYGFVTPSKLGSIIRVDYLRKYASTGKAISNFIIDKVLDISSLFFLAIVMGYFFKDRFSFFSLGYLVIIFGVLIFLFVVFYNKKSSRFLLGFMYHKLFPKKLKDNIRVDFNSFYDDLPKKRFLILVFGVNIFTWINTYLVTYLIGLSLGINLSFVYFLAILPLATIVAQIPITINGLGTREATLIGLFSFFGVGAAKVFSMSILTLALAGVLPAVVACFLILRKKD
ncbi:hypothetical protein CMI37_26905 [Candidatus Pacearchaeota archaeon]|nr:hypothetical protein [Candidatus Pacearchaeota archaeon]|tara:strand:- start:24 stop:947 length:924 start_codon:yes stop_codon:yes gene_type:complete